MFSLSAPRSARAPECRKQGFRVPRLACFLPSVFCLLLSVLFPSCSGQDDLHQEMIRKVENGLFSRPPALDEPTWTIEERMKHYRVPGVSIAVIWDHKIAWTKSYGVTDRVSQKPVTPKTLFQAGSSSMPVTALAALNLVKEGKIKLEDDINALCASFKLPPNEFTLKEKVTLERVLDHHGGITVGSFPGYLRSDPVPTLREILDGKKPAANKRIRVVTEPGKSYIHSAGAYTVLQQTLEDITEKSFPDLVADAVFKPVRMSSSFYGIPEKKYRDRIAAGHDRDGSMVPDRFRVYPEAAAYGLWSTPEDLARLMLELQLAVRGRSDKVVDAPLAMRMTTPISKEAWVGLGFYMDREVDESYFVSYGECAGYSNRMVANRDRGFGAVVMTNSGNGDLAGEIIRSIARAYEWDYYLRRTDMYANFYEAAVQGDRDKLDFFLKNGLDVDFRNDEGLTALMLAGFDGQFKTMDFLLKNGADINASDENGIPLLILAVKRDLPALAEYLIRKGADININDKFGYGPLLWAATLDRTVITEMLTAAGAKPQDQTIPAFEKVRSRFGSIMGRLDPDQDWLVLESVGWRSGWAVSHTDKVYRKKCVISARVRAGEPYYAESPSGVHILVQQDDDRGMNLISGLTQGLKDRECTIYSWRGYPSVKEVARFDPAKEHDLKTTIDLVNETVTLVIDGRDTLTTFLPDDIDSLTRYGVYCYNAAMRFRDLHITGE